MSSRWTSSSRKDGSNRTLLIAAAAAMAAVSARIVSSHVRRGPCLKGPAPDDDLPLPPAVGASNAA